MVHLGRMSDAEAYLADNAVDIILLDIGLPDAQGLEAVRRAHAAAPRTTLVVLTGLDDESLAARALQEGAQDYLVKGQMETRSLVRSLRFAVERKGMEEALFAEKERAQITLNSIADAVVCTDISGNISFLNLVAETMTGWSLREAQGRPTVDVLRILDAASRMLVPDPMERAVRNDSPRAFPRIPFLFGATEAKFRSKTLLRQFTIATANRPVRSSFSTTSVRLGRWQRRPRIWPRTTF